MKKILILLFVLLGCKKDESFQYIASDDRGGPKGNPLSSLTYSNFEYLTSQLDILVVVDNSGSMSDKQAKLAQHAGILMDALNNVKFNNVDWRMTFISTDFYETPATYPIIDRKTPDVKNTVGNIIRSFGTDGSALEYVLNSTEDFLFNDPMGRSFMRKGAIFALIYLSDEDLQGSANPINLYKNIQAITGSVDKIVTFGIVSTSYQTRHVQFIQKIPGVKQLFDIASGNFGAEILKLSKLLVGAIKEGYIILKDPAKASSIRVILKGKDGAGNSINVEIPALPSGYWYYDPEVYGVIFTNTDFVSKYKIEGKPELQILYEKIDRAN